MENTASLCTDDILDKLKELDPATGSIVKAEFLVRNAIYILKANDKSYFDLSHTLYNKEGYSMFHADSAADITKAIQELKSHVLGSSDLSNNVCVTEVPEDLDVAHVDRFDRK